MNAHQLVELPLGSEGLGYIRRSLERGHSLSRAVLRELNLEEGSTAALLPAGTDMQRVLRLDEGGLVHTEVSAPALRAVSEQSLDGRSAVFIGENRLARRGDEALVHKRVRTSFFENEVYHWTSSSNEIPEVVRAAASHGSSYFVSHTRSEPDESLSQADLDRLARNTALLAVDAYDDETFVIWRPRDAMAASGE